MPFTGLPHWSRSLSAFLGAKGGGCSGFSGRQGTHGDQCDHPVGMTKVVHSFLGALPCLHLRKENMRKARLSEQKRRRNHYTNLIRNQATAPKPKADTKSSSSKKNNDKTKAPGKTKTKQAADAKKKGEKNTKKRKR